MRIAHMAAIVMIALMCSVTLLLSPRLPECIACHWDFAGEPNGYMPKIPGLFILPLISLVILIVFMAVPGRDPFRANIEAMRKRIDELTVLFILFLMALQAFVILWNLGIKVSMHSFIVPGFALLIYHTGLTMEHSGRNHLIGIRTSQTLKSEEVWHATHLIAGKAFKIAALVSLGGLFAPREMLWFTFVPAAVASFYSIAVSRKIARGA
jgi:uncharacterized membrane protein